MVSLLIVVTIASLIKLYTIIIFILHVWTLQLREVKQLWPHICVEVKQTQAQM